MHAVARRSSNPTVCYSPTNPQLRQLLINPRTLQRNHNPLWLSSSSAQESPTNSSAPESNKYTLCNQDTADAPHPRSTPQYNRKCLHPRQCLPKVRNLLPAHSTSRAIRASVFRLNRNHTSIFDEPRSRRGSIRLHRLPRATMAGRSRMRIARVLTAISAQSFLCSTLPGPSSESPS